MTERRGRSENTQWVLGLLGVKSASTHPGERRRIAFLNGLALVTMLLSALGFVYCSVVDAPWRLWVLHLVTVVVMAVAFVLGRRGHLQHSALIAAATLTAGPLFLAAGYVPDRLLSALTAFLFLPVPLWLLSTFLRWWHIPVWYVFVATSAVIILGGLTPPLVLVGPLVACAVLAVVGSILALLRELDAAQFVQQTAALHSNEQRFALALEASQDGIWQWDLTRDRVTYSERWAEMVGLSVGGQGMLEGGITTWLTRVHPDDLLEVKRQLENARMGSLGRVVFEHRIAHQDGTYRHVLVRAITTRREPGNPVTARQMVTGAMTDITKQKQFESQLLYNASHDDLTGIANRPLLLERIRQALAHSRRQKDDALFAVLYIDIDRFKSVNDLHGHPVGDQVLCRVAERLKAAIRDGDIVARLGGDEFAVLLDDLRADFDALRVAKRLQELVAAPVTVAGATVVVTASVGVAQSATGYTRPEDMLRDADTAMCRAKELGRSRYQVFDQSMHERAVERLQLEAELTRATEENQLALVFQPIVSLPGFDIVAFEVLVRWRHPTRGFIAPMEFIPIAEESGQIIAIDRWVLKNACQQLRRWTNERRIEAGLTVAVNVSAHLLATDDVESLVLEACREADIKPEQLCIEVTERILIKDERAAAALTGLRDHGVRIHLDDFGTGYSSLSYLSQLPIDSVKIDRSFINKICSHEKDHELVRTIVQLSHTLAMTTVAEGVETADQLRALSGFDCDFVQGYLLSRPVAASDAINLLNQPLRPPQSGKPD